MIGKFMQFKGRSLYNLLKNSYKEDRSLQIEPWQILDYRHMPPAQIFLQLYELGVPLTQESFLLYSEKCETPEELIECLWIKDSDLVGQEKAYLLLFELWRRFLPEKQSLSIFCDELDFRISLYDENALADDELIQQSLTDLENILDQSVDQGAQPKEIFQSVLRYSAHDLEGFLYDFIVEQLEDGNEVYASELIDGFYEYMSEPKWFDFLRARLFFLSDPKESDILIRRILEQVEECPDLSFMFEICQFLIHRGDIGLFLLCVRQTIPLLQVEEDFQKLLQYMAEFYRCLDKDVLEKAIKIVIENRKNKGLDRPLDLTDKTVVKEFLIEHSRQEIEDIYP
jgi:hypothetical protein